MASAAVEAWCGFGEVRASVDAIGSGGLSAVDDERVPDGEGGAVGAEPEDRVGDLVGGAQAADGFLAMKPSCPASESAASRAIMGVSMTPGQMALMRMPDAA